MDTINEPVAWMVQYKDRHEFRWSKPEHLYEALACEPLYTHPAKELTDEEINEVFSKTWLDLKDYKDFARAILRKAQENGRL